MLYWGIPEYRLPNDVLAKEIRAIEKAGVHIHTGVRIGMDLTMEQLRADNDAVYIAIGTQKSKRLDIPGETLPQVESGLSFLRPGWASTVTAPSRAVWWWWAVVPRPWTVPGLQFGSAQRKSPLSTAG